MTPAPSAAPEPGPRPRRWFWRLVVLLILAIGAGGYVALQKFKPRPVARAPVKQLALVRVERVEPRTGPLPVRGHGVVRSRAEVSLAAEVSGRVVHVNPRLVSGASFGAGEVLVRVDAAPFESALAQARADRASARAAVVLAEQTVARTEELIAKGFLSRQALDERIAARDQARAALARAEAVEGQRRLDLARCEIRAPFGGQVLSARVDVGDTTQPGRELARIFDSRHLEVPVSLTDRDMALIGDAWASGAKARAKEANAAVYVEHGGAEYRWTARIDRVEALLDSATRTFNLVVSVLEPQARGRPAGAAGARALAGKRGAVAPPLLVGMFTRVEIQGRDPGPHLLLPRAALRDAGQVWVLDANSAISIRTVRVLREDDRHVAIAAEGIEAGALVVVSALPVVTEGMQVRASEAQGGAARR